MADEIRYSVNRYCVLLRPRAPFLKWMLEADPYPSEERGPYSAADFQHDQDVFLIPSGFDMPADAIKWVERRWRMFFEYMLHGWYTDEGIWPSGRSLKMFRDWVEVEAHSMVWDLAAKPFVLEDWTADED
jgi:hypothetical protein